MQEQAVKEDGEKRVNETTRHETKRYATKSRFGGITWVREERSRSQETSLQRKCGESHEVERK